MEWQVTLLLILGSLIVMMAMGMPAAFCFIVVNIIGVFLLNGEPGMRQLIRNLFDSVTTFALIPIPLFILMGEVMFRSGVGPLMIDALDKWLGRLPGRLGLLAVGGGALFATLSGASIASSAMLVSVLSPEMEKRGYKKPMSLGPILGSGGLATMIPPSGLGVILAAIGQFSVGTLLIAIILPGLLMAALYATYIILRCQLQPHLAPAYEVRHVPLSEKLIATIRHILPLGFIVFLVIGVIFLGIATPTEAAAAGALGTFILAAFYKRLNWQIAKEATSSTFEITVMVFMILIGAKAFSQLLAFSGATSGLLQFVIGLELAPILVVTAVLICIVFLGMFISSAAIIVITIPLFLPVVMAIGFDPVWFGVLALLAIEVGFTSPPFGLVLYVVHGAAPRGTTMGDVYKAALPFIGCDIVAMTLILVFPTIAMWLPGIMR